MRNEILSHTEKEKILFFENLIKKTAASLYKKSNNNPLTETDFIQEAFLIIANHIKKYDSKRGSFEKFLVFQIRQNLKTYRIKYKYPISINKKAQTHVKEIFEFVSFEDYYSGIS